MGCTKRGKCFTLLFALVFCALETGMRFDIPTPDVATFARVFRRVEDCGRIGGQGIADYFIAKIVFRHVLSLSEGMVGLLVTPV